MRIIRNNEKVKRFWEALKGPAQRLIMLDYDGTLAPFRVERNKAFPYPGIREILDKIAQIDRNRIVVISGRSARELRGLLPLSMPFEVWGAHGMERIMASGESLQKPLPPGAKDVFLRVAEWAQKMGLRGRLEKKYGSCALHTRGLDQKEGDEILCKGRAFFKEVSKGTGLSVREFDGGIELRTRGIDKGTAVRKILSSFPEDGPCAYFGDDLTDEDAFSALGNRGVSFLVRPEFRNTRADVWIRPPDELKDCLTRYIL